MIAFLSGRICPRQQRQLVQCPCAEDLQHFHILGSGEKSGGLAHTGMFSDEIGEVTGK